MWMTPSNFAITRHRDNGVAETTNLEEQYRFSPCVRLHTFSRSARTHARPCLAEGSAIVAVDRNRNWHRQAAKSVTAKLYGPGDVNSADSNIPITINAA